ncbi:MAG: hypothetical protein F4X64_08035 [Chloroflexi bacterium]|nr:hypothetical protein [Chloroflexota bacterium]
MKHEMFGVFLSALVVIATAVQAAMCPLGSQSVCTPITASSIIFGLLGLVCLGACTALYFDRKNEDRNGNIPENAQQDG